MNAAPGAAASAAARRTAVAACAWLLLAATCGAAAAVPKVASINVCTDQLVLSLADPEQILTVSWLSADPEESVRAAEARRYPLNYGSAEELLRYAPDVVVAGSFTSAHARSLLAKLGYEVVTIPPANGVDDIERNIASVAAAVGRPERGAALIEHLRETRARLARSRRAVPVPAVVVRPGGFTTGKGSLADELMALAGLVNVPAEQGLDRWGSLSMETLLRTAPELLILTGYRDDEASLANAVLAHPALRRLRDEVPTAIVPAAQWSCGLPESLESVETMQSAAARLRRAPPARAGR
ncbi:MAG: ABC transporter substrate-binding protein [Gammaproteobacteria bacterium]|nr:ABC transporter substrate-binding protein [Gammaproteobacteria bacterium]